MPTTSSEHPASKWVLPAVAVILASTTLLGWHTLSGERTRSTALESRNRALETSLAAMQNKLESMSGRLAALNDAVQSARSLQEPIAVEARKRPAARYPAKVISTTAKGPATKKEPGFDPRVDRLQTRLSEQELALSATRSDLSSARDEFSGAIAKTNEELQELRRRGERSYHEFDVLKSKEFRRSGPLMISLRKADTKRKSYNVKLRINDQEFEKKNVNIFEPVWVSSEGMPQPLQLVVNDISKDRVRGYVSEPRHRESAQNQTPPQLLTRE